MEYDTGNKAAENNRITLRRHNSTSFTNSPTISEPVTTVALSNLSTSLSANVSVAYSNAYIAGTVTTLFDGIVYSQLQTTIGHLHGRSWGNLGNSRQRKSVSAWHNNASTQSFIIREGESFAVWMNTIPYSARMVLTFRHAGVVYQSSALVTPFMHAITGAYYPSFNIRNLTGSGSNVEVLAVDFITEFFVSGWPLTSFELIDDHSGGTTLAAVANDSASGALPSGIELKQGALTLRGGFKRSGAWITRPWLSQNFPIMPWLFPQLTWAPLSIKRNYRKMYDKKVVLREGEGVAMLLRNGVAWCYGDWLLTFSVSAAAAGGGNTYSRGRVVNS